MNPKVVTTEQLVMIPSYFLHANAGEGKPLLILAHGFSDSGASFFRRVAPALGSQYEVIAPNGLFPQFVRQEGIWKEAYAWFFADLAKDKIYIHPDVCAKAVASTVAELGLAERPKILMGFSQGGYFLPYLAKELKNVRRLVALGSGFRVDDFEKYGLSLPISAVHGDADEVIPMKDSYEEFQRLGRFNTGGDFHVISGMSHSIDDKGLHKLRELLL